MYTYICIYIYIYIYLFIYARKCCAAEVPAAPADSDIPELQPPPPMPSTVPVVAGADLPTQLCAAPVRRLVAGQLRAAGAPSTSSPHWAAGPAAQRPRPGEAASTTDHVERNLGVEFESVSSGSALSTDPIVNALAAAAASRAAESVRPRPAQAPAQPVQTASAGAVPGAGGACPLPPPVAPGLSVAPLGGMPSAPPGTHAGAPAQSAQPAAAGAGPSAAGAWPFPPPLSAGSLAAPQGGVPVAPPGGHAGQAREAARHAAADAEGSEDQPGPPLAPTVIDEVRKHGDPLVARMRGPPEQQPTKEDFFRIPREFSCGRPVRPDEVIAALKSEGASFRHCSHHLDEAGCRAFPYDHVILPVAVAIYCMYQVAGFPPELCAQSYTAIKAACLHIDSLIHLKGSLEVKPRAPQIGVAAPGSKKTPVQMEFAKRILLNLVMEKFPFLFHSESEVGGLCWEGGSTAGFLKQLRGNGLCLLILIEELLNFFDVNYPISGQTNQQNHLLPGVLLPLRTGNGLAKALSSDLGNKVNKSQVAMLFMAQEDVVREVFCGKRALSTGFLQGFAFTVLSLRFASLLRMLHCCMCIVSSRQICLGCALAS